MICKFVYQKIESSLSCLLHASERAHLIAPTRVVRCSASLSVSCKVKPAPSVTHDERARR